MRIEIPFLLNVTTLQKVHYYIVSHYSVFYFGTVKPPYIINIITIT